MARRMQEEVEAEIAVLGALILAALRERWKALYGNPAPRSTTTSMALAEVSAQEKGRGFHRAQVM